MKSKLMIFVIIIVVISSFVLFFGYIGQGGVRHVQIYLPEKIESTISFQNIYFRTCEKFRYRIGEPWTPVTAPPGPWVFNFEIEFMESRTFSILV